MSDRPSIVISERDSKRLEALLERVEPAFEDVAAALEGELARAEVRASSEMPADVVTMNSQVRCVEEGTNVFHQLRLVYPHEVTLEKGNVSVLAPVGAALLGLAVGQSITWALPSSRTIQLRVVEMLYQPEAAGIYA